MMQISRDRPNAEMEALLRQAGSQSYGQFCAAMAVIAAGVSQAFEQQFSAKALDLPLKPGVFNGDITSDIFESIEFAPGAEIKFPLDFVSPTNVNDFIAYTVPSIGAIPQRHAEGDYVMVPIFMIGTSIDWGLEYARDARWDVVSRFIQTMEAMFIRKMNNDAWHTLLAAAVNRNLTSYDDAATAGLFTKRLKSLMEIELRRNGGGNSTSVNRAKLSDLYMSPEAKEDMFSWDLTQVPDAIRTQIFLNGSLPRIGDVAIHDIDELGEGQEYQDYCVDSLSASLPSDKEEFVLGLDLIHRDSFVHPWRDKPKVYEDVTMHRQNKAGLYGRGHGGWAALSAYRCILGAL
jgi:hypothetical protein